MSNHLKGLLLTVFGVIILSPDALLIRLVDANTWTLLFWRGLLFALGISLVIFLIYRGTTLLQFLKIGRIGLLLGVFFGFSTVFFVTAIQYTSIANALVIISTSPVFAALFSWAFLKEKTPFRVWVTMFIIIVSMVVIMENSYHSGGFWGDVSALMTSILIAADFTIARWKKDINMVPAMAIGGIVTASISAVVIAFSPTVPLYLAVSSVPIILLMGFIITLAFSLIMLGPRYMPAAEVSMIMPLETVFGTFLAWVYLNETPSIYAVIGGSIILITLSVHAWLTLKRTDNQCA